MSESLWLSKDEMIEMTGGLTQGAAQIRWLRENGIEPYIGRDGRPRVPRSQVSGRPAYAEPPAAQPNFGALDAAR